MQDSVTLSLQLLPITSPPPIHTCCCHHQVSSYDLVNPGGRYCNRVRLLGSYHARLAALLDTEPDALDVPDGLYGNVGGAPEQVGQQVLVA